MMALPLWSRQPIVPVSAAPNEEDHMRVRVIGIDCATDPAKTGLALGAFENGRVSVEVARVCSRREDPSDAVCGWLAAAPGDRTLIAVDAPLGWPTAMGAFLSRHSAGQCLDVDPKTMFRRMTDIRVRMATGKTPLDVGADRIARTAHAALALLQLIRELTGLEIPLAWTADFDGCAAIEVYPAATLCRTGSGAPATRPRATLRPAERCWRGWDRSWRCLKTSDRRLSAPTPLTPACACSPPPTS